MTSARLMFFEEYKPPYNEQLIFLCEIIPKYETAIQEFSEEAELNKHNYNIHTPTWANSSLFSQLPFLTPQLQAAIVKGLSKKFPKEPIKL